MRKISLIFIACTLATVTAQFNTPLFFPQVGAGGGDGRLTVYGRFGNTDYDYSGTLGDVVAAISTLGILVMQKISLLATLGMGKRRKRDTISDESELGDMDPIFGAISAVDHADCGKLLVCNVFAKVHNELTTEEDLLGSLFKNVNRKSDPWHPKAQYILAAKIGSQRNPNLCTKQYHKCPYHPDQLSTLLKKQ